MRKYSTTNPGECVIDGRRINSNLFNGKRFSGMRRFVLIRANGRDSSSKKYNRPEGRSRFFPAVFKKDGLTLEAISDIPVLNSELDSEDPRISCIDNHFYISYVKTFPDLSEEGEPSIGCLPALARTDDFFHFHKIGLKGMPLYSKDFVLFDKMINGEYVALHKPTMPEHLKDRKDLKHFATNKECIWIAYSKDLNTWYNHEVLLAPDNNEIKIGAGAPPILTTYGWLLMYHGVEMVKEEGILKRKYNLKAALLDTYDPRKVLMVSGNIAEPETDYERHNSRMPDLQNLFGTSITNVYMRDGQLIPTLIVGYGGADVVSAELYLTHKKMESIIHDKNNPLRYAA